MKLGQHARLVTGVVVGLMVAGGTAYATTVDTDQVAADTAISACVTPAHYIRVLSDGQECRRRETAFALPSFESISAVAASANETSDALDQLSADFADFADQASGGIGDLSDAFDAYVEQTDGALAGLQDNKAENADLADEIDRASAAEATLDDQMQGYADDLQTQINDVNAGITDQSASNDE
ncbi:MAG: hypothetical protein EBS41_07575, partial [Actinobacteria bacterium]|nr:hypothetical protein [Actinomycetota bacterium]